MGWYQIEVVRKGTYRLYIEWWRPSFWRECYRTLRNRGSGVLSSAYYTAVLVHKLCSAKSRRR